MKTTLKNLLSDALRVKKVLSRDEVFKIAEQNGFLQSTAERYFREDNGLEIPCVKLNSKKKTCSPSEFVAFYLYAGGKTIFYEGGKKKVIESNKKAVR